MNELQVKIDQEIGVIQFNYQEIKESLAAKMALYKDAKFTEDSKTVARAEVASLRKIKKAIDDKRKEVKESCLIPYVEFEKKATELMSLVDGPIVLIDKQVKAFEEKRKAEKREQIKAIYDSCIDEFTEFLTLERIYDTKWDSASKSIKSIKEEILSVVSDIHAHVDSIMHMQSDATEKALRMYKKSLNLSEAINYINDYERQKAQILLREEQKRKEEEDSRHQLEIKRVREEERRRVEEEEKIREEERIKAEASQTPHMQSEPFKDIEEESAPFGLADIDENNELPFMQPSTIKVVYTVIATQKELEEVEIVLNSLGIYFSRKEV